MPVSWLKLLLQVLLRMLLLLKVPLTVLSHTLLLPCLLVMLPWLLMTALTIVTWALRALILLLITMVVLY